MEKKSSRTFSIVLIVSFAICSQAGCTLNDSAYIRIRSGDRSIETTFRSVEVVLRVAGFQDYNPPSIVAQEDVRHLELRDPRMHAAIGKSRKQSAILEIYIGTYPFAGEKVKRYVDLVARLRANLGEQAVDPDVESSNGIRLLP